MAYTLLDPQPPLRDEEMLDKAYPEGGTPDDAPYNQVAPGLYPNEKAFVTAQGDIVAIAVESRWLPNNEGVVFNAWGRLINADGSTKLAGDGDDHIETEVSASMTAVEYDRWGQDALAREMLLVILGEPETIVERPNPPPPDINNPPEGWTETFEAPLIGFSHDYRLNASIQHAMKVAQEASQPFDPAALISNL